MLDMDYLNWFFAITVVFYTITVVIYKIIERKDKSIKSTGFIALITCFLALYAINCLLCVIFKPHYLTKILMLVFAISPFIIGRLAQYKNENLFSIIQIVCMFISALCVYVL